MDTETAEDIQEVQANVHDVAVRTAGIDARLKFAEEHINALLAKTNSLEIQLEAERRALAAVKDHSTIPALVRALTAQAVQLELAWGGEDLSGDMLAEALRLLAETIKREAS
jgi:hypothetical protein